jgi:hypothetical protein
VWMDLAALLRFRSRARLTKLDIDRIHETGLNGRYETILLTRAAILWGSCSPDVFSRV